MRSAKAFLAATMVFGLAACDATKMNTWQVPPTISAEQAAAENEECRQRTDREHPEIGATDFLPYVGVMFSLHRGDVRERFYLDCMRKKGFVLVEADVSAADPAVAMRIRAACQSAAAKAVRAMDLPTGEAGKEYDRRVAACLADRAVSTAGD